MEPCAKHWNFSSVNNLNMHVNRTKYLCFVKENTYHRDIFFLWIRFSSFLCFLDFRGLPSLTLLLFCLLFCCLSHHKLTLLRLMKDRQKEKDQSATQHFFSQTVVFEGANSETERRVSKQAGREAYRYKNNNDMKWCKSNTNLLWCKYSDEWQHVSAFFLN